MRVLSVTRLLTEAHRAVLSSIDVTPWGIRYRFQDQMSVLRELAKRLGFYEASDDRNTNAVERLILDLQSRGQIQRMPLRNDQKSTL